ncbi:MAG: hypothetical protein WBG86_15140 [Polyangiales bacterium]
MSGPGRWLLTVVLIVVGVVTGMSLFRTTEAPPDGLAQARLEARQGRIAEASALLEGETASSPRPSAEVEALRVRLIAAKGEVRLALIEVARSSRVEELASSMSVVGTLHETLKRAGINAHESQGLLARHALGYGEPAEPLDGLDPTTWTVLDALRDYEMGRSVDTLALEEVAADSNELPRFIRLVKIQNPRANPGH